jgi:dTDP-4-dehydrorhamnose 3,5-epimerase
MNVVTTSLPGVVIIEPRVLADGRGEFFETFRADRYAEITNAAFVQDNVSVSRSRVLRGMHLQEPRPQAKLVSVLVGEVFDVAADVRVGSPTFGRWTACRLSGENRRQLFVPAGYAHGFVVLGEDAVFSYKCSDYYHAESEITIRWDDPELAIEWPVHDMVVSARDADAPFLSQVRDHLPRFRTS